MAVITRRAASASRFASCKAITPKRVIAVRASSKRTPNNTRDTTTFKSAMAFSGPAPEAINGRLAMLGFTAAVGAELASGTPLVQQFSSASGPVLATFAVLSLASLIPILKGANLREALGPFKPEAELLNGRLAMLGLVALGVVELVKGSALF